MKVTWLNGTTTYFSGVEVYQYDSDCIELLDKKGNVKYVIPIRAIRYLATGPEFKRLNKSSTFIFY